MPSFSATRLTLARERRGYTRKQLAEQIGVSSQSITAYESKLRVPDTDKLPHIAQVLTFPLAFFLGEEVELTAKEAVSFRSRHALKAGQRDKALRTGDLATQFVSPALRRRFRFPITDIPDFSREDPERAARLLRQRWKLGLGPIHNMVHLLESKGVEVYWLEESSPCLDAFCFWHNDLPFVLLNNARKAGDRDRFNLAHELAHLVLHRHERDMDGANLEAEADTFASAFLLPSETFRYESPRYPLLNEYGPLKQRWGVSMQAMIRRGHDLGVFTDWYYEQAFKQLSSQGWRTQEPHSVPRESSLLHKIAFDAMAAKKQTPMDFAGSIHISSQDLAEIMPVAEEFISRDILYANSIKEYVVDDLVLRLIE